MALSAALEQHESDRLLGNLGPDTSTLSDIISTRAALLAAIEAARTDLRVLDTLTSSSAVDRAAQAEQSIRAGYARREEEKLGRTKRAELGAQGLAEAARRAAGETIERRLERVLPLMSELYSRLRPHPIWCDIDYKIRGDVRRFLKLQVGDELNPQFMFSSGQRRATGLAFLLAVNLSMTWTRWNSILLDDPVQHVDDFRSIHLAEVLAQLARGGRQIICAVEDPALADLLCRRLPISDLGEARRVSLGLSERGTLTKTNDNNRAASAKNPGSSGPPKLSLREFRSEYGDTNTGDRSTIPRSPCRPLRAVSVEGPTAGGGECCSCPSISERGTIVVRAITGRRGERTGRCRQDKAGKHKGSDVMRLRLAASPCRTTKPTCWHDTPHGLPP